MELDQAADKGKAIAAEPSTSQVTHGLQRNQQLPVKEQPHLQVDHIGIKVHHKVNPVVPYNILDSMKKMNVTMSMWDSLAIPGQKDMLHSTLSNFKVSDESKSPIGQVRTVLTNNPQEKDKQPSKEVGKEVKPPLFYVSVIIGDKLVHKYMVDSGASSLVIPKQIVDKLGLKYQPLEKGVIQLDGTSVNALGVIKDLSLTLHACPNF